MKRISLTLTLCILSFAHNTFSDSHKPALPFYNPHWAQQSPYPVTHTTADFSPLPGPLDSARQLSHDEITWKPTGLVNAWAPMYSSAYPNGKRVIWIGGHDRIAKLDEKTLETLATYTFSETNYMSNDQVRRHIDETDALVSDSDVLKHNARIWKEAFGSTSSVYRLLTNKNELFIPHLYSNGQISLRVYGDKDASEPTSEIELRREWIIPEDISKSRIMSVNMTPDGQVVMVTQDGVLMVLSEDLRQHHILRLPRNGKEESNQDFFGAFVRNGLTVDDQGGIYVVTRDHMHRVQWTGTALSLSDADGAWSTPYPNELGIGSGTTPGLMGWGEKEDHLVIIADGTRGNQAVVFWRDDIPENWKGLPGYSRRVAGVTPIKFGAAKNEIVQVENAPIVYGHGAFFNNTFPEQRLPDQGSLHQQWFAESFYMHVSGHEAKGGAMIHWNQETRTLETAWTSNTNFVSTVCTVSGATDMVYCWGARNRQWTLEATDWHTGESRFYYILGASHRYNPLGGSIIVNRWGGIDCGCAGGLGMVRISPRKTDSGQQQ
jgi:hypothetical protein